MNFRRLLPYHVVADYEEDEDENIINSSELMSKSQRWEHDISTKMSEFTTIFEKQVDTFNHISNKKKHGEMRTEERLMIENLLLQDEKRALFEARAEMESRQIAGQMAAMAHSQADFSAHSEMTFGGVSHATNIPIVHHIPQQVQVAAITSTRWGNNGQGDENEEATMWRDE